MKERGIRSVGLYENSQNVVDIKLFEVLLSLKADKTEKYSDGNFYY